MAWDTAQLFLVMLSSLHNVLLLLKTLVRRKKPRLRPPLIVKKRKRKVSLNFIIDRAYIGPHLIALRFVGQSKATF